MMAVPPPDKDDLEAWLRRIRDPETRMLFIEYIRELMEISEVATPPPPIPPTMAKPVRVKGIEVHKCRECGEVVGYPREHVAKTGHTMGFDPIEVPIGELPLQSREEVKNAER